MFAQTVASAALCLSAPETEIDHLSIPVFIGAVLKPIGNTTVGYLLQLRIYLLRQPGPSVIFTALTNPFDCFPVRKADCHRNYFHMSPYEFQTGIFTLFAEPIHIAKG